MWVSGFVCLHGCPVTNPDYSEKSGKHKTRQHMDSLTFLTLKRESEQPFFTAGILIKRHNIRSDIIYFDTPSLFVTIN